MKLLIPWVLLGTLAVSPLWGAEKKPTLRQDYLERSLSAEKWTFEELPHHIGSDLKETFWNRWHLLGLAAGTGLAVGIHEVDPEIQGRFHPEDPMGGSRKVFNTLGNSFVLGGSVLTATIVSKLTDHPKATLTAGTMLESLAVTYTLTFGLKLATHRERPDGSNSRSFPSAHASGSFTLATVTEVFFGPLYGVPSYLLAGTIAIARLDSNRHAASDTIAGALLGTLIGLGTAKFHKKERQDLFVTPGVVESGVTLNLTKLF